MSLLQKEIVRLQESANKLAHIQNVVSNVLPKGLSFEPTFISGNAIYFKIDSIHQLSYLYNLLTPVSTNQTEASGYGPIVLEVNGPCKYSLNRFVWYWNHNEVLYRIIVEVIDSSFARVKANKKIKYYNEVTLVTEDFQKLGMRPIYRHTQIDRTKDFEYVPTIFVYWFWETLPFDEF